MKMCNQTLKFYVLGKPNADGTDTYTEVTVKNCSWFKETVSSITDKGPKANNSIIIRIPAENVPSELVITKGMKVQRGEETVYVKAWTDNRNALRGKHIKVVCA